MIQGRRLGRPLLGKWQLCSFVVSVIGLSTLLADSSPREAPPACQLHSIRKPRLLLCTVLTPSSTLLCFLIYIPLKLHCDLSHPLVAPTKRWFPASVVSLLLLYFQIRGDILISHSFPYLLSWILIPGEDVGCLFLSTSLFSSLCLLSYLSLPNKHLCRPPIPNLSLPLLITLQAGPWAGELRRGGGGGTVSFVKLQNSTTPPISGTRTQAQLVLSRKDPQSNDSPLIP